MIRFQYRSTSVLLLIFFTFVLMACGDEPTVEPSVDEVRPKSEAQKERKIARQKIREKRLEKRRLADEKRALKKNPPKEVKLLKQFASSRRNARYAAAIRLRELAATTNKLADHLEAIYLAAKKRKDIQAQAVLILLPLGEAGEAMAAKLTNEAADRYRLQMMHAYLQYPRQAVTYYRSVLTSGSLNNARLAARMLAKLGPESVLAVPELRLRAAKWVSGSDAPFIQALTVIGPEASAALPELFKILAIEGRGLERRFSIEPPNYKKMAHFDSVQALVQIGRPAVPELRARLNDEKGNLRLTAAMILAAIGLPAKEALPDIITIANLRSRPGHPLSDSVKQVQKSCIAALGRMGPEGCKVLADIISKARVHKKEERHMADGIEEGMRNGGANMKPYVKEMYKYLSIATDYKIIDGFIDAMFACGPDIIPSLIEGIQKDRQTKLRINCTASLARFGPKAASALPVLFEYLQDLSEGRALPGTYHAMPVIIDAVSAIGPHSPEAVAILCKVFFKKNPSAYHRRDQILRANILVALSSMKGATAKELDILLTRWKKIKKGDMTIINSFDNHLLLSALGTLAGTNNEIIKLMKVEVLEGLTVDTRLTATMIMLQQGAWVPESINILAIIIEQKEMNALCDAIAMAPEAKTGGEQLAKLLNRLKTPYWGRPALLLAQINLDEFTNSMHRKAAKVLSSRPPKVGKIDTALYWSEIESVIQLVALTGRTDQHYAEKLVKLLNRTELHDLIFETLGIVALGDEAGIDAIRFARVKAMDPAVEARLGELLLKVSPE